MPLKTYWPVFKSPLRPNNQPVKHEINNQFQGKELRSGTNFGADHVSESSLNSKRANQYSFDM